MKYRYLAGALAALLALPLIAETMTGDDTGKCYGQGEASWFFRDFDVYAEIPCNEPPPPPPVDTDGDGIPDSEDECLTDPTNTCNEPPPPPPVDAPTFVPSVTELPAAGGSVSFAYDTKGETCPVSGPGIPAGFTLTGVDAQPVPGTVVPPATFVLACPDVDPVSVTITAAGSPPPPPPPVDSDGDGVPDDQDPCPNDATDSCVEPPPPPPVAGEMRGIPGKAAWAENVGTPTRYSGGDIVLNGTANNLATVSCFGDSVSLSGGQASVSGSYYAVVDCVFPNGRLKIGGDHAYFDEIHTSDIDKAGFAIAAKDVYIENSSARNHRHSNQDRHGFQASCGSSNIVIVNSESSLNSGDGFQAGHGCSGSRPRDIFIGGFTCNANRENCVDAKYVDGIVFSNITTTGHGDAAAGGFESGSDGSSVIFGSDGDSLNAWLIDSTLDDVIGIRVEKGPDGVILGNRFESDNAMLFQHEGNPLNIRNNFHRGATFIGKIDRPFNFFFEVHGNDYTGSVNPKAMSQSAGYSESANTDISDLESKFQARFGFPLETSR